MGAIADSNGAFIDALRRVAPGVEDLRIRGNFYYLVKYI